MWGHLFYIIYYFLKKKSIYHFNNKKQLLHVFYVLQKVAGWQLLNRYYNIPIFSQINSLQIELLHQVIFC